MPLYVSNSGMKTDIATLQGQMVTANANIATLQTQRALLADATYWVDQATGSDSNDGLTAGTAFATLTKAVSLVPLYMDFNFTINVKAGTYSDVLGVTFFNRSPGGKKLTFTGQDWTNITPATGPGSGTFDSNTGPHTLGLSTATWTVNDLRGRLVNITSGAQSGKYYPIISNTATTIDIGGISTTIGNASFQFVIPAVTFSGLSGMGSYGRDSSSGAIVFNNIRFTGSGAMRTWNGTFVFNNTLQLTTSGVNFSDASSNAAIIIKNSYITGSNNSAAITGPINVTDCAFYGGGTNFAAITGILISGMTLSTMTMNGGIVIDGFGKATSGCGIALNAGILFRMFPSCTVTIRNCTNGIYSSLATATDPMSFNFAADGSCAFNITNMTAYGIRIGSGTKMSMIMANPCVMNITGCGSDAIYLESNHNQLNINSTSNISGNTGFGINMAGTNEAGLNNIKLASTVTMGTNTAGDITVDGTTPMTIAALRALAGKVLVDVPHLNRIISD